MAILTDQKSEVQQHECEAKVLTEQQFSKIRHHVANIRASVMCIAQQYDGQDGSAAELREDLDVILQQLSECYEEMLQMNVPKGTFD